MIISQNTIGGKKTFQSSTVSSIVKEKNKGRKTQRDPGTLLTRQDPFKTWLRPINFFLLKRRRFDFFKKKLTWTLDRTGHQAGSQNYGFINCIGLTYAT
jgi:hypothetical protein